MVEELVFDKNTEFLVPILQDDNPKLREISKEVTEFDDDLKTLVKQLVTTMVIKSGAGLAAIQIGVPKRVIVALDKDASELLIMINPIIKRVLNRSTVEREGCLSVPPSKWRPVSRPAKCDIEWMDFKGNSLSKTFTGHIARVIQHEIDHLDGVIITDKPLNIVNLK